MNKTVTLDYNEYQKLIKRPHTVEVPNLVEIKPYFKPNTSGIFSKDLLNISLRQCELSDPKLIDALKEIITYNEGIKQEMYKVSLDVNSKLCEINQANFYKSALDTLKHKIKKASILKRLQYLFTGKLNF